MSSCPMCCPCCQHADTAERTLQEGVDLIDHAIELGYLGEGSTNGWAKRFLFQARDAGVIPHSEQTHAKGERDE